MIRTSLSRRALLGAAAAAGVVAAAVPLRRAANARAGRPLALIDPDLTRADLRGARPILKVHNRQKLERDVVWHWRRELRARFADGEKAIALVRWDKAFVLAGLAREEGIAARQTRIGHSLFRIDLG